MKGFLKGILLLLFLGVGGYIFFNYYSYIFAKNVIGQIVNIEKVANAVAVVGGASTQNIGNRELFSVAILIKDVQGKFWASSSEDRQWGVVEKGMCLEARLLPYAPWKFEKGGTYFGARLIAVLECSQVGMQAASIPNNSENVTPQAAPPVNSIAPAAPTAQPQAVPIAPGPKPTGQ